MGTVSKRFATSLYSPNLPPTSNAPSGASPNMAALDRGHPLGLPVWLKTNAIVAKDAVLGAEPEESPAVLEERSDGEIGQPLIHTVILEAVLLSMRQCAREECQRDHRMLWTTCVHLAG
jgi:hypothetical protein